MTPECKSECKSALMLIAEGLLFYRENQGKARRYTLPETSDIRTGAARKSINSHERTPT
jgi:hypothetical protein